MVKSQVRILVADSERAIRRLLRTSFHANGYNVIEAATREKALREVMFHRPDLMILDLWLPSRDGIEVVREVREWTQLPIIMLSASEQEAVKVAALDAGADDFVTKPFGLGELMARIRAALRHAARVRASEPVFSIGEITVDLLHHLVKRSGHIVQLTPIEFHVLRVLVAHAGKVVPHQRLMQEIWGTQRGKPHALRVHISNLRSRLEEEPFHPRHILTEHGVGYRLYVDD